MSRIPPVLAYLVIYNPTLQPDPEELTGDRDEDDVTEQAHVLFYTARERAVSRDRILRQVGLAKALANFAEMFTSRPGFDNVHAQKSRLVMISPESNFWIHACVNLAKTPKLIAKGATPPSGSNPEEFDYHNNSVNDEVLRTQLLHAFRTFKLQYGGFTHIMETEGVRVLERRIESFFTPWAWQWNVGGTPEFGRYLGLPIHPLKKQFASPIADYISHVPDTPTLILAPPHVIADSSLPQISPILPLAHFLEHLIPLPISKPDPPPLTAATTTATPMHMLTASGNAVAKYIAKPAAQVVDPRNWSWPALTFRKGSMRAKGKGRDKAQITTEIGPDAKEPFTAVDATAPGSTHSKEFLGPPADSEASSRASRSVSPSTIDHASLLDAQQDPISNTTINPDSTIIDPALIPLPDDSDSDSTNPASSGDVNDSGADPLDTERAPVTPRARVKSSPESTVALEGKPITTNEDETISGEVDSDDIAQMAAVERERLMIKSPSDSLQSTPLATVRAALPLEDPEPENPVPQLVTVSAQISMPLETSSGAIHVWLDSLAESEGGINNAQRQRLTWIAIPGLLVAGVTSEENENVWKDAARQLLFSIDEIIQKRQLTAAETTLRALNTTKIIAQYSTTQLSGSPSLPQFTSESPSLFSSARALQFATSPAIREIVTQTKWGTWCAARQSTIKSRVYIEVDRKDANLVDVDHELGSACRRWDEYDI